MAYIKNLILSSTLSNMKLEMLFYLRHLFETYIPIEIKKNFFELLNSTSDQLLSPVLIFSLLKDASSINFSKFPIFHKKLNKPIFLPRLLDFSALLRELNLKNFAYLTNNDLIAINKLVNLENFDCSYCDLISSLESLQDLKHLRKLSIKGLRLLEKMPLNCWSELIWLDAKACDSIDKSNWFFFFSFHEGKQWERLKLSETNIDKSVLVQIFKTTNQHKIVDLDLSLCDEVGTGLMKILENCTFSKLKTLKLKKLELLEEEYLVFFDKLYKCEEFNSINLARCLNVCNLSAFSICKNLKNVTSINLDWTKIDSVGMVEILSCLRELKLLSMEGIRLNFSQGENLIKKSKLIWINAKWCEWCSGEVGVYLSGIGRQVIDYYGYVHGKLK